MIDIIERLFDREKIEYRASVPFSSLRVISPEKLTRRGIAPDSIRSAIVFLVPHIAHDRADGNICLYARPRDYHAYAGELLPRLESELEAIFPRERFYGFADKSPLSEVGAAAVAGLGVIGKNMLLINGKYASLVFIFEILSTAGVDLLGGGESVKVGYCDGCGACLAACPMEKHGECLSALTQKKGALSPEQEDYIREYGYAWGCDICQLACPHTRRALESGVETPVEYFRENRVSLLTEETLGAMSTEEFGRRAFSWRGRAVVERNLEILKTKF